MEQTMISKSRLLSRSLLCVLIVMLGAVFIQAQTDLTGFWVFKVPRGDGTFSESYFELKQSGETITGNTVGGRVQSPVNEGELVVLQRAFVEGDEGLGRCSRLAAASGKRDGSSAPDLHH